MSKKYYVSNIDSEFRVYRPNGGLLTCAANEDNAKYICAELNRLLHRIHAREEDEMELFPPATLEDAIKNTGSTPKYNPCRKFRKGDIVTQKAISGRFFDWLSKERIGLKYEVLEDEEEFKRVIVRGYNERFAIDAAYLELVTPVEEIEPYFVGESETSYDLFRKTGNSNQLRSSFWWKHNPTPELIELSKANAKAAAQAECDRLNAEYRKEMEK